MVVVILNNITIINGDVTLLFVLAWHLSSLLVGVDNNLRTSSRLVIDELSSGAWLF